MKTESMYLILILSVSVYVLQSNGCILFPYGPIEGDTVNDKNDDEGSPMVYVDEGYVIPLFDENHEYFWVNTNGLISFHEQIYEFTPEPFPSAYTDPLGDFVAPYWADADTRFYGGNVYHRQITNPKDWSLIKVNQIITDYVPGHEQFCATWVLVATWELVPFYTGPEYYYYDSVFDDYSFDEDTIPKNTFQCVLASDGRHSFAIFNYDEITWTTGMASGGDQNGLGGEPAYVGYTGGDAISSYYVPESGMDSIVDIDDSTNIGQTGRYVFRLEDKPIEQYGCDSCDYQGRCKLELNPGCDCRVYHFFCIQDTDEEPYYQKAAEFCHYLYDGLAILDTEQKDLAVLGEIEAHDWSSVSCIPEEGFWIGLDDHSVEDHFVWSSDVVRKGLCPGDYSNWGENEPDDNDKQDENGQDYVQIWYNRNGRVYGQWDDEYFSFRAKGVICETRVPHCDYDVYCIDHENISTCNE